MSRITIALSDEEKTALRSLAEKEFRDPRQQAALIIRRELERQGLVESASPLTESEPKAKKIRQRRKSNAITTN
jgi:hypothetical protein